jgi:hypothetical protein
MKRLIIVIALLIGGLSSTGLAVEWEGTPAKDAMLRGTSHSGWNHGITPQSFLGIASGSEWVAGIQQWDLPAEINNTYIESATITYDLYPFSGSGAIGDVAEVLGLTQSWLEGTCAGDPDPACGGASDVTYDGINNWATAFGDTDGVVYDTDAVPATYSEATPGTLTFDVTALVQKWANGQLANNGVKIRRASISGDGLIGVWNREDASGGARLNIVYDPSRRGWQGTPEKDAMLRGTAHSGLNHGVTPQSFVGRASGNEWVCGIQQWDLPVDIDNSYIESATVTYDVYPFGDGDEAGEVLALTQSWLEGTGWGNDDATSGGCSDLTYDGINNWATPFGDTEGIVYDTQPIPVSPGTVTFDVTALVQKWANGELPNNGIKLAKTDGDDTFGVWNKESAESGGARLKIVYNPDLRGWQGTPEKDAMLRGTAHSGLNHGITSQSFVGRASGNEWVCGIQQWNLPLEINNGNIVSATVTYDVYDFATVVEDGEVTALTQSWLEGTGAGHDDETSAGCSDLTYDGINEWATPFGDTDGVVYDTQPVPLFDANSVASVTFDVTALVQKWADGSLANNGIKLAKVDGDGTFGVYNREHATGGARLAIVYEQANCPFFLDSDLNKDCVVDANDILILAANWLDEIAAVRMPPEKNPLIYVPEIGAITVDGDLSDWSDASAWADFGPWWHLGAVPGVPDGDNGLASTTRARYAWNDAGNLLYIGIESDEPDLILEIGGLMGDAYDANDVAAPYPDAPAGGSGRTTQIEFKNWSGSTAGSVTNQIGGTLTGVTEAFTLNAGVMTIEIETPIYSDWYNSSTAMNLVNQMDIYEYADVFDATGAGGGDSQIADGTYIQTFTSATTVYGSLLRLIQSAGPQSCADVPEIFARDPEDLNEDCIVNFGDFSEISENWMNDSIP